MREREGPEAPAREVIATPHEAGQPGERRELAVGQVDGGEERAVHRGRGERARAGQERAHPPEQVELEERLLEPRPRQEEQERQPDRRRQEPRRPGAARRAAGTWKPLTRQGEVW